MKKIDLVYILGSGSCWNNNEIRFSLRSAEKYFEFDRVFIIGEMPEWMQNVTHIDVSDDSKNKLLNARKKYIAGAKSKMISDNFILMNDDFFFLKPVKEIKYYSRGTLDHMIEKHPTRAGYYFKALYDTKQRLNLLGIKNPKDFEIHAPIIFNKNDLLVTISMMGIYHPFLLRTAYGNLIEVKSKKVRDFKAENFETVKIMEKEGNEFLSITNSIVANPNFREWIKEKFPEVSRFENDGGDGVNADPGQSMVGRKYYALKEFMYCGKQYTKGQIISHDHINELRNIPKMREVWEFK